VPQKTKGAALCCGPRQPEEEKVKTDLRFSL
jgi:hypothetical protein